MTKEAQQKAQLVKNHDHFISLLEKAEIKTRKDNLRFDNCVAQVMIEENIDIDSFNNWHEWNKKQELKRLNEKIENEFKTNN